MRKDSAAPKRKTSTTTDPLFSRVPKVITRALNSRLAVKQRDAPYARWSKNALVVEILTSALGDEIEALKRTKEKEGGRT